MSPEDYLARCKNPGMIRLYRELRRRLGELLPEFGEYAVQNYIGYKKFGKRFAEILVQQSKIRVNTLTPPEEVDCGGYEVPQTHRWSLPYELNFYDDSGLNNAIEAIKYSSRRDNWLYRF